MTSDHGDGKAGSEARWSAARRGRIGWYGYDWANSVFTTTVTSIFFGPFITGIGERAADADGYLRPLGFPVFPSSLFPYLVTLSVFLQIFALPTAAALTRRYPKGVLLGPLSSCGAMATIGMYGIGDTDYALGAALYLIATMALGASITVANTYLPVLAPPEHQDRTSAQASAAGFLSGGVVLVVALYVYANHEAWGMPEDRAVRLIMLSAGLWWLVFGAVAVWLLRGYGSPPVPEPKTRRTGTYRSLFAALRLLRRFPGAAWFLVAFLFYNNGLQAVTSLVGTYAAEELRLPEDDVVTAVLLVQFVAFAGAVLAGRLAEKFGGRRILLVIVLVWSSVVVAGGLIPDSSFGAFMTLCVSAGIVVGGTYALSRSVFLGLVPGDRVSEFSGIFETVNRCLGFLGPAAFGGVLQWSGNYRAAWSSILLFFLAGALALMLGSLARRGRERGRHQEKEATTHV
ncbi:MFS transporter [Amycolatopsis endophytica]|uniref:UMF1 family MFS transporter n=1 Tax=Amycolatopsis endophytica TaxID=860233 RepID=A0A853AY65_9PSEU|nr:MFS transporter [Amycolatopsis endophytica]NYI87579.1 UMF1 family MFS transporter [Amycolatopsis endophytica]